MLNVGTYTLTVTAAGTQNYNQAVKTITLTVTKLEAPVAYIGQTLFVSSGSSATTAQVTLTASIDNPSLNGILSTATVEFWDITPGRTPVLLAKNVPVSIVAGSPQTGTANTTVTLSTGQYGLADYLIEVRVTGTNYTNVQQTGAVVGSDAYNAAHPVVTVMQPLLNSIRASGDIDTLSTVAGSLSSNIIGKVHYNIGLTYAKSGTNLKGQVQLWYHRSGTAAQGGGEYYIKSNALSSLSMDALKTTGTLYTKASIYKIVNGVLVSIDGNVTRRVDMLDGKSTTDASGDRIAFTVISSRSELYYSNNW